MHSVLLQCNFELVLNIFELVHNQFKGDFYPFQGEFTLKILKLVIKSPFQGRNFLVEEVGLR